MNEKKKQPDFDVQPALVEFDNERDYITEVGFGQASSAAHRKWAETFAEGNIEEHPERFKRYEVVIRMPDPTEMLETPEAKAYSEALKAKRGITLKEGLRDYIGGKLSTMPPYMSVLENDPEKEDFRTIGPEKHQEFQTLADGYTVGSRSTGGSSIKAKAKKLDAVEEQAKAAGFKSFEDALAAMKAKGIIG